MKKKGGVCKFCEEKFIMNSSFQKYCIKCRPIIKKRDRKIYYKNNKEKEKILTLIWREKNKKIVKENWRKWYQKNNKMIGEKRKREDIKEMRKKNTLDYRKKYPKKIKAISKSRIIRIPKKQLCQKCNEKLAKHKHHPDYKKPMKVIFLCIRCHTDIHSGGDSNRAV